jgi:myosin protein heavy chain
MSSNSVQKRNNPFARAASPSTVPGNTNGRPKSTIVSSPLSNTSTPAQNRVYPSLATTVNIGSHNRSHSKNGGAVSSTFAPSFINTEEMRRPPQTVNGIEGENDFSGKRYVWLKDPHVAFVKGWIVEDLGNNQILVQCDDGSVCRSF